MFKCPADRRKWEKGLIIHKDARKIFSEKLNWQVNRKPISGIDLDGHRYCGDYHKNRGTSGDTSRSRSQIGITAEEAQANKNQQYQEKQERKRKLLEKTRKRQAEIEQFKNRQKMNNAASLMERGDRDKLQYAERKLKQAQNQLAQGRTKSGQSMKEMALEEKVQIAERELEIVKEQIEEDQTSPTKQALKSIRGKLSKKYKV